MRRMSNVRKNAEELDKRTSNVLRNAKNFLNKLKAKERYNSRIKRIDEIKKRNKK
jgi:hypothetical protein